jgi:hypothetical protein
MSKRVLKGYDGSRYQVGDRIEVHPSTQLDTGDLWMRGARYGVVTGTSLTEDDRVRVELDNMPGRTFRGSEDTFRALEPRKGWSWDHFLEGFNEKERIIRRIDRQQAAESDPKVYHSHPPQYGRLEPGCPRCDQLRHGAPARVGRWPT